jgi:hypothetical protein
LVNSLGDVTQVVISELATIQADGATPSAEGVKCGCEERNSSKIAASLPNADCSLSGFAFWTGCHRQHPAVQWQER